ncbi:MAG: PhoH family protein [Thermoleophilia bacterium]|nr:PhoH family protein [Thermoleophilia bacterium]
MKTETLSLDDYVAVELAGHHDAVLDALRERAGCSISLRGNELTLSGDQYAVERGIMLVGQLAAIAEQGKPLTADMVGVVDTVADDSSSGSVKPKAKDVFTDVVLSHRGKAIGPKTVNQKRYIDAVRENTVTFGVGPAGTGKTYLAMALAVDALIERRVARIVLTRPAVEAGEPLGFLPGSMLDKVDPYLRPLYDALYDMMEPERLNHCMEQGIIEVAPLAYMRGRTLNDAFVVLDEAQNTSPEQMKLFLTRLGFGSKMVVTGDVTQTHLPHGKESGLVRVGEILKDVDEIAFIRFDQADVVRHRLVQRIVAAYESHMERERRTTSDDVRS